MSPLVSQGLELAMYGMGVVFVFLTLLVLATMAMSRLVLMTTPIPEPVTPARVASHTGGIEPSKLAAISAAVHQHRQRQQ